MLPVQLIGTVTTNVTYPIHEYYVSEKLKCFLCSGLE
jgi:hypothetical protein